MSEAAQDQGWRLPPKPDLVEQARVELEESAKEPECSEDFGLEALAETRRLIEQRRRQRLESSGD